MYRKFRHQVINVVMLHQGAPCAAYIKMQTEIATCRRVKHFQKDSKESVPSFPFLECMLLYCDNCHPHLPIPVCGVEVLTGLRVCTLTPT
jgi:hypothetical protein